MTTGSEIIAILSRPILNEIYFISYVEHRVIDGQTIKYEIFSGNFFSLPLCSKIVP